MSAERMRLTCETEGAEGARRMRKLDRETDPSMLLCDVGLTTPLARAAWPAGSCAPAVRRPATAPDAPLRIGGGTDVALAPRLPDLHTRVPGISAAERGLPGPVNSEGSTPSVSSWLGRWSLVRAVAAAPAPAGGDTSPIADTRCRVTRFVAQHVGHQRGTGT